MAKFVGAFYIDKMGSRATHIKTLLAQGHEICTFNESIVRVSVETQNTREKAVYALQTCQMSFFTFPIISKVVGGYQNQNKKRSNMFQVIQET